MTSPALERSDEHLVEVGDVTVHPAIKESVRGHAGDPERGHEGPGVMMRRVVMDAGAAAPAAKAAEQIRGNPAFIERHAPARVAANGRIGRATSERSRECQAVHVAKED
jgi:hypothetical protein